MLIRLAGTRRAISMASSVLPTAVGPVITSATEPDAGTVMGSMGLLPAKE